MGAASQAGGAYSQVGGAYPQVGASSVADSPSVEAFTIGAFFFLGEASAGASSVESRPKAKSLFDGFKVVSLPALSRPLLLVLRDAATLHLQLRLAAAVPQRHGDGGVVLCGAETLRISDHGHLH